MSRLIFLLLSVTIHALVGPFIPALLLSGTAFAANSTSAGLLAFLVAPTAFLLGAQFAVVGGLIFAALVLIAVRLLPSRILGHRVSCIVLGVTAGAVAASIWLIWIPANLWLTTFLAPSVVCGGLMGWFAVPRMLVKAPLNAKAQSSHVG